jgi:transposase-like protein
MNADGQSVQHRRIAGIGRLTFPNNDAIRKVLYLAILNATDKWTRPIQNWGAALNQFVIEFGDERVPLV